jgi:hypothetical protein
MGIFGGVIVRKKHLVGIIAGSMILGASFGAVAASNYHLIVNGKTVKADVKMINDRTYVPLRAVSEALGAKVDWDGASNTVTISGKDYSAASSDTKSFPVDVDVNSGPMKMKITKITLDPSFKKDQYMNLIKAVVLSVEIENTSTDTVNWYPAQGTISLNTKEQSEGESALYSDDVEGEFLGNVVKKGNIVFEIKGDLSSINHITYKISGASNDKFDQLGDATITDINLH